jgi:hypothetical protein
MAEKRQTELDPTTNEEARRLFSEIDRAPVVAAGAVPDGHEGVYAPNPDEHLEGARRVAKAQEKMAALRQELAEERLRKIRLGKAAGEDAP